MVRFKIVDDNDRMVGFVELVVPLVEDSTKRLPAGQVPEEEGGTIGGVVEQLSLDSSVVGGSTDVKDIDVSDDSAYVNRDTTVKGTVSADEWCVFDHWVARKEPRSRTLTPSRLRLIRKGLSEATAAECCKAIDGLFQYRQEHQGSTDLSAIFQTYPGGSPLRERIDFFISQVAGDETTVAGSEHATSEKLQRAKRDVLTGWELPGSVQAQESKAKAVEWLKQVGWEVIEQGEEQPPLVRPVRS